MTPHTMPSHLEGADLTDRVGGTPLVPIRGLADVPAGVEVLGKAEWLNPGGSVKDRAALAIVRAAERSRALRPGGTILDATSGNTGIAYAWIGARRGYRVLLTVPANAGRARTRMLASLGAEVVLTDPMEGTDGAVREARRLAAQAIEGVCYVDQYSNPANWRAHYDGTAEEIWRDTGGRVTHLVAGIGTSGTLVGAGRRLRELKPGLEVVAVQPDSPYHALEGLKHLPSALTPAIYDASVHQRVIEVASEEAIEMAKRQARLGLPLGGSAGAAVVAAARVARALERGLVVAVLPDSAERYLGDPLWEDPA